jgi:DNA-binding GntR family transcriptional regulator
VQKASLKQRAYEIIKDKIINCEYLPNTFLNESILAEITEASRTPIREALNKLEQENLVVILPKKGIMVSELSINDINMIYQTRQLIETHVVKLYGDKIDKIELLNLRQELQMQMLKRQENNMPLKEIYRIDNDLHMLFINKSGNRYYKQIMEQIYSQNQRLRALAGVKVEKRLEETHKEHVDIIDYLLDDKIEEAVKAMAVHLENSKKATFASFMTL